MKQSNRSRRFGRTPATLMAGAALLATTLVAPAPVRADPTLTAVAAVAGGAVVGTMLWNNRDSLWPLASATRPGGRGPHVSAPYPAVASGGPPNAAVIYTSVAPYAPPIYPTHVVYQVAPSQPRTHAHTDRLQPPPPAPPQAAAAPASGEPVAANQQF
ncbi:MAG: hypothetical protein HQL96_15470 [Magnetococcales bacterium]|nr:hypothetical protein [Magnetococcales bacterium]